MGFDNEFKEKYGVGALEFIGDKNNCPHHWVETGDTFSMEKYGLGIYTVFFCVGCAQFTAIDKELGTDKPDW